MKYFFKKSKAISLVLAAAMVTAFAAESADSALYSPLKTRASGQLELTGTTDPPQSEIGGAVLNDVFGETTFYRWEEVRKNNYPKDSEEHPSLFIFGNNNEYATMFDAPDCIYMGKDADVLNGVTKKLSEDSAGYKIFDGKGDIDESDSYFLKFMDKGRNNQSLHIDRSAFFTNSDCNAMYVKYVDKHDGHPRYELYIKGKNGLNYYLEPDEGSSQGMLDIETETAKVEVLRKWEFLPYNSDKRSKNGVGEGNAHTYWYLFHDDGAWGDDEKVFVENGWLSVHDGAFRAEDDALWYIGTPYHFSTVKSDVTVRENQILAIGAEEYVDTSGAVKESNGCIIPNGRTITIEKGGILSVSGQLINNGTIINNGGTILVRDGGTIGPFIQGTGVGLNGCGTLKCCNGDIIIQEGGALYAGMADEHCQSCPFYLDGNSTLINMGLLVYGAMKLGDYANLEFYETSRTYGSLFNYKVSGVGSYYLYKRDANGNISDEQYGSASELKNNVERNFSHVAKYGYTMREYWLCKSNSDAMKQSFGDYMAFMIWEKTTSVPASDLPSGWNKYFLENNKSPVVDYWTHEYTFLDSDVFKAASSVSYFDTGGADVKSLEHIITTYSGMYVPYDQLNLFRGTVSVSPETKVNVYQGDKMMEYKFAKTDSVLWDPTYATHMHYGYNQWKYKELIL